MVLLNLISKNRKNNKKEKQKEIVLKDGEDLEASQWLMFRNRSDPYWELYKFFYYNEEKSKFVAYVLGTRGVCLPSFREFDEARLPTEKEIKDNEPIYQMKVTRLEAYNRRRIRNKK